MADAPQQKSVPIRMLIINMMFSGFIAIVVFVILNYAVIIPRLFSHEQRIRAIETQLQQEDDAEDQGDEGEDADPEAGAPTPAAPSEAAPAPAPAPGAAPTNAAPAPNPGTK